VTKKELLKKFPDTKPGEWRRHPNGKGWVKNTARVDNTAYVGPDALVYDNARVWGDAQVYGNARVCGDARVCGNARVYGNARVCGDARVYGNARVKSGALTSTALSLTGSRHLVSLSSPTEVSIGCHTLTFARWRKSAKAMARAEDYSFTEMKEYLEYVNLCEKRAKAMRKDRTFVPVKAEDKTGGDK
jgi:carbonic anhydrase/acetyltransferase-like protein (isoleucine patch superfamily)